MAFRARKVVRTFEKRAPGPISSTSHTSAFLACLWPVGWIPMNVRDEGTLLVLWLLWVQFLTRLLKKSLLFQREMKSTAKFLVIFHGCVCLYSFPNFQCYIKILESDWSSTALLWAVIVQLYASCLSNWTVRVIKLPPVALEWVLFQHLAQKLNVLTNQIVYTTVIFFSNFVIVMIN